jgi:hypothetical protein
MSEITRRIRINRSKTASGKQTYDATVEIAHVALLDSDGGTWLRKLALAESDALEAELRRRYEADLQ